MAYSIRKPKENVRAHWEENTIGFETDKTADEIRSFGGSQKYGIGTGGKWINDVIYQSIGGYRSRGGIPLKLRTKDEIIPISETDAQELLNAKLIKTTWG
jgi:hypothetical protein